MQHGAGAGIEWVAVIKCVGCGMQHPCTHAPPDVNLYPNSEKQPKRVENPTAADCKSLPKQQKPAEKVENPAATAQKSLPKQRKTAEKGRESQPTLLAHTPGPHSRPTLPAHTPVPHRSTQTTQNRSK